MTQFGFYLVALVSGIIANFSQYGINRTTKLSLQNAPYFNQSNTHCYRLSETERSDSVHIIILLSTNNFIPSFCILGANKSYSVRLYHSKRYMRDTVCSQTEQ